MKKRAKKYLAVMALSVLIVGTRPDRIMAQELAETAETMEQKKEDISTAQQVENGIVVLENQGNFGSVDLTYADDHYTIKCDYSEYEIAMGALCRLEIHPLLGYQVDFVKVNQNLIRLENEACEFLMQEDFTEISIGYAQTKEMQNSTKSETFQDNRIPDSSTNSVSAVSHDVKVIYLNEEKTDESETNVIPEENMVEETENVVVQTEETQSMDEGLTQAASANEIVRNFEETEEKELEEEERTEEKQDAKETEDQKTEEQKRAALKQENKAEEAKEERKMGKSVKTKASYIAPGNERKFSKISTNETSQIKKKSFLNISNLLLYLMIICCILLVRYKKMDKKGRGING